jgi:hypothetical protein
VDNELPRAATQPPRLTYPRERFGARSRIGTNTMATTWKSDASWDELRGAVTDETAFRTISPDDDHVRRAWLSDDASFYLRCSGPSSAGPAGLAKPYDPGDGGDIDLTARPSVITDPCAALSGFALTSHVMRAEEFFTWRWAG